MNKRILLLCLFLSGSAHAEKVIMAGDSGPTVPSPLTSSQQDFRDAYTSISNDWAATQPRQCPEGTSPGCAPNLSACRDARGKAIKFGEYFHTQTGVSSSTWHMFGEMHDTSLIRLAGAIADYQDCLAEGK